MVHHVASKNPLETAVELHLGVVLGLKESRSPRPILWGWGTLRCPPEPCAGAGWLCRGAALAMAVPRAPLRSKSSQEVCPAVLVSIPVFCSQASLALWRFPLVWAINILSGWMFIYFFFINFYGRRVVKENREKLFARNHRQSALVSVMQLWAALPFIWSASNT